METQDKKACLYCERILSGRSDKKFCDDNCRNQFNNQHRRDHPARNEIRKINNLLLTNRNILDAMLGPFQQARRIALEKLSLQGFQPNYYTHSIRKKGGRLLRCCYDIGFLPLNDTTCLVTRLTASPKPTTTPPPPEKNDTPIVDEP